MSATTKKLGELLPIRVMVREQNQKLVRRATKAEIAELADLQMIYCDGDWFASNSHPQAKFGSVMAVMPC